jgi:Flp pilus assembly protein TadG
MVRQSDCLVRAHVLCGRAKGVQGSQRQRRGEQGNSIVEFAFAGLILVTLMFGMIHLCLGLYTLHFVAEAAQQGTRYAMVRGSGCSGLTACPAAKSDIQNYVMGLRYPGIRNSLTTVSTSYATYPVGGTCSPSTTCNNPGNLVTVTVSYQYPLIVPFEAKRTLNFSSTSTAVIAQ